MLVDIPAFVIDRLEVPNKLSLGIFKYFSFEKILIVNIKALKHKKKYIDVFIKITLYSYNDFLQHS